jgi:hypothetical protein
MMEAIRSSETLIITRTTRRNIPEDGILHYIVVYISGGKMLRDMLLIELYIVGKHE